MTPQDPVQRRWRPLGPTSYRTGQRCQEKRGDIRILKFCRELEDCSPLWRSGITEQWEGPPVDSCDKASFSGSQRVQKRHQLVRVCHREEPAIEDQLIQ